MRLSSLALRIVTLLLVAAGAVVAACSEDEPPTFVSLHVERDGAYTVNARPVARATLESELSSLRPKHGRFGIGFQVAPSAPYEAVQYAMSVAQGLGATVGIVGNERF